MTRKSKIGIFLILKFLYKFQNKEAQRSCEPMKAKLSLRWRLIFEEGLNNKDTGQEKRTFLFCVRDKIMIVKGKNMFIFRVVHWDTDQRYGKFLDLSVHGQVQG